MMFSRFCIALFLLNSIAVGSLADEFGLPLDAELPAQASSAYSQLSVECTDPIEATPFPAANGWEQNYAIGDGFFAGVGGSFNSVRVSQELYASGALDAYMNNLLVATGEASGPAAPFTQTETTFAPVAQLGFFRTLSESSWQWGAKFSYKYLGLNFTDTDVDAPQYGAVTPTPNAVPGYTFTGHEIQESVQTSVNHQLSFFPLLGRSFNRGRVYFGGGPVAFQTDASIYQAIGFANLNGEHTDITGWPVDFADSQWMWGGGGQFGFVHHFTPNCFLDFSYDFVFTGDYTINNSGNFQSQSGQVTSYGELHIDTTRRIYAQSLNVTICTLF